MTFRAALVSVGIAFLAVIAGGIGGFLSHAYLELWFDPVEGIQLTHLETWAKIPDGLRASFDLTQPEKFRAYYGENAGNGVTEISTADIVLRNFERSGKLVGVKRKLINNSPVVYSLTGYANSERMVLTQRGPMGGIGSYFVVKTQDHDSNIFYFGNFLTEDYEPGSAQKTVTQCPFVMMDEAVATAHFPTAAEASSKIAALKSKCSQYQFPTWQVTSQ
jgi:hypothetical protein